MDVSPRESAQDASASQATYPSGLRAVPSISLILPACNEQETIEQAIREADEALAGLTAEYEILVIDDGSTDATAAVAAAQARQRPAVRILRQPRNLGYGAALRRGFQAASKSLVAFTDADCQFDVRELDRLVLLARHHDIACGYRIERQDPWRRKLYSKVYNGLVRLLLGTGVRDCDCAFKLFRRELVQSLPLTTDGFFINAELLAQARLRGQSIVEVGVTHRPRLHGQSTVSALQSLPVAAAVLRFWWQTLLFPPTAREERASGGRWSGRVEWGAVLLLCLASLLLLLSNLSYPLIEPDETRYAQIALEMVDSGDWVTPALDGKPYLDKPPLLYWLTAASYKVCGANETAARLPCALSAWFTVVLTYGLGRRLVGGRAAWCGALALLLCGGFVLCGRFLIMDGPLTLFTTATLLAAYVACGRKQFRLPWWLLAGTACALGVLTKGPIAIVLCVPPLLLARWLAGQGSPLGLRHWLAFAAPVLLVNVPWFVAIAAAHDDFSIYFFWKHHVVRFVSAFNHGQPWWFYVPVGLAGMFPCSLLLPPLALFLFGRSAAERQLRFRELGFLLLAAVWIVAFFSASSCKLPTYILPALPPLCLLLGSVLDATVLTGDFRGRVSRLLQPIPRRAAATILALTVVGAVIHLVLMPGSVLRLGLEGLVAVGAGVLLAVVWRIRFWHTHTAWAGLAALAIVVMALAFDDALPVLSRLRSIHLEAAELHERHQRVPVVYFGHDSHSAVLHLKRDEFIDLRSDQLAELAAFVSRRREVVLVTTPDVEETLRRALGASIQLQPAGGRGHLYLAYGLGVGPASSTDCGSLAQRVERQDGRARLPPSRRPRPARQEPRPPLPVPPVPVATADAMASLPVSDRSVDRN